MRLAPRSNRAGHGFLEFLDLHRNRRLRQVQFARGAGEALMAGGGGEQAELVQRGRSHKDF